MFTHYRCGGRLIPEWHHRWALERRPDIGSDVPVLRQHEYEELHRCEACGLVGIAGPVPSRGK